MNRRTFLALAPVAAVAHVLPPAAPATAVYDIFTETLRAGAVTYDKMRLVEAGTESRQPWGFRWRPEALSRLDDGLIARPFPAGAEVPT